MSVPKPESLLALLDAQQQPIRLDDYTLHSKVRDTRTRQMLLAMNALAYICAYDTTAKSCAAGMYSTLEDKLTILLSGSAPISALAQATVRKVVTLLKSVAKLGPLPPGTKTTDFLAEITLLGFDKWRKRAHVDDEDQGIWDRRIRGVREKLSGENLATFDQLVARLDALRTHTVTFKDAQASDERSTARAALFSDSVALDNMLQDERLRRVLHWTADATTRARFSRIFDTDAPVFDYLGTVEDGDGRLREDFSIGQLALNVLANYRCARWLVYLAVERSDYFRGEWPRIVFCSSVERDVPIDTEDARRVMCGPTLPTNTLNTRTDLTATGFLHAVPNLLEQLLAAQSTPVVVQPVIGTSSLVCAGCDLLLQVYMKSREHLLDEVDVCAQWPKKFHHAGSTGVFTFPWLSPDLRTSHDLLHNDMQLTFYYTTASLLHREYIRPRINAYYLEMARARREATTPDTERYHARVET